MIALWFYASVNFFQLIGDTFEISVATMSRGVTAITDSLFDLKDRAIRVMTSDYALNDAPTVVLVLFPTMPCVTGCTECTFNAESVCIFLISWDIQKLQKCRHCLVNGKLIYYYNKLFKNGHILKVKLIVQWTLTRWSRIRLKFWNILSRSKVTEKTRLRGHCLINFVF